MEEFALLALVGFFAQLVDGALGMAYGTVSASVLLALGIPPANASAAVHSAQIFTCAASGVSHIWHGNVSWPIVIRLTIPGIIGAIIGAILLTSLDAALVRPWIAVYLSGLGLLILYRVFFPRTERRPPATDGVSIPLGFVGAFADSIGGGGWGPIATSTLIGRGHEPRFTVGSVNTSEFIVKTASAATFFVVLGTTHLDSVLALVVGGIIAAPLAGYIAKIIPARFFMALIGFLVVTLSIWQILRLLY